ncbi:LamG domain-containing protein [Hydrocoleum sp. CS-953]|uniref:LamG domain-containing protein n=1 Tax=Hydrocoleum sp. CS-953 TaxID=1671698 RepID=UPI001FEF145E|nr:LamG domain-containing protein [Hydrocoleum sp. CS-953]
MKLRNLLLVTISIATSMILAILFVAEFLRAEKINYALFFDGVDDYIQVENTNVINKIGSGDFTFSVLVSALESEQVRHPQIMSNRPTEGIGFLFGFHGRWRGSKNKIPYVQLDDINWIGYPDQPNLLDGQWHHFVARKQGDRLTYFADGKLVASLTTSRIGNYNLASEQPLLIGWDLVNQSQTHFKGKIDELSIWNRALTDAEIESKMLYSLRGNEPGLISYWPFDEGSGNLVRDKSGNGNDGTIYGGAVWTTGWVSEI